METASGLITRLIYDSLIQANPKNGQPEPNMATFTQSSDGKTYTFEIDARAVWSDGRPVIAEDWYIAKKLVAMSKVTARKSLFQDITGWGDFVDGKATEISGVKIDSANPKKFAVEMAKVSNGDCSVATRKKHYETLNKILNEEQPYNFGFSPNTLLATSADLQNVRPGTFDTLYNIHEWWFRR